MIDYETPTRAPTIRFLNDGNDISFNLNIESFHQVQPGYACIKNVGFEDTKNEIVYDYIEVIKFVTDPREIGDGLLHAELLEDGSGMVIMGEPLVPRFFIDNIDEISKNGSDGQFLGSRKRDYMRKMKIFQSLPKQHRATTIYFPKNMVGTNQFIGFKKKADRKLVELRMFSNVFDYHTTMNNITQIFPGYYVFWKIGIKGTMDDLCLDKHIGEGVGDALTGFQKLSLKSKAIGTNNYQH